MHAGVDVNKQPAGSMPALVFTDCDLKTAAQMQAKTKAGGTAKAKSAVRRREVKVGGKRVKTIDVHAHCVIPEAFALLGLKANEQRGPGISEVGERRPPLLTRGDS